MCASKVRVCGICVYGACTPVVCVSLVHACLWCVRVYGADVPVVCVSIVRVCLWYVSMVRASMARV